MTEDRDHTATRLFVTGSLAADGSVSLDADQLHYLRDVMRKPVGADILLFNGSDGEWRGRVEALGKKNGSVRPRYQTRKQANERPLWLLFAPIKRQAIDTIAEKATELGVTRLVPVITERTNVARVNTERLRAIVREAAEQTERLTLPEIAEPQRLDQALAQFPPDRRLILCDESGTAPPLAKVLQAGIQGADALGILTGPEGGFAPHELDGLRKLPFVSPVGLGPRVLRADTAALAALAVFQALAGDWQHAGIS
jgi:16S rRNA (uracil1498-N3)-methyltransferase